MEQRKLSDQANTLVDLSKASPRCNPARLQECFSSLGDPTADLADCKTLRFLSCQLGIAARGLLPVHGRRKEHKHKLGGEQGGGTPLPVRVCAHRPSGKHRSPSWGRSAVSSAGFHHFDVLVLEEGASPAPVTVRRGWGRGVCCAASRSPNLPAPRPALARGGSGGAGWFCWQEGIKTRGLSCGVAPQIAAFGALPASRQQLARSGQQLPLPVLLTGLLGQLGGSRASTGKEISSALGGSGQGAWQQAVGPRWPRAAQELQGGPSGINPFGGAHVGCNGTEQWRHSHSCPLHLG